MSKSYAPLKKQGTVSDVESAIEILTGLYEEIDQIIQNASGTAAENSPRIETLTETAEYLSNIDQLNIPERVLNLTIEYTIQVARYKSIHPSRQVQCDNAVIILEAAKNAVESWMEQFDDEQDLSEEADFVQAIDEAIDNATSASFPGMYQS